MKCHVGNLLSATVNIKCIEVWLYETTAGWQWVKNAHRCMLSPRWCPQVVLEEKSKGWGRMYNMPPCRTTDQLLPHEHSYNNSNDITTMNNAYNTVLWFTIIPWNFILAKLTYLWIKNVTSSRQFVIVVFDLEFYEVLCMMALKKVHLAINQKHCQGFIITVYNRTIQKQAVRNLVFTLSNKSVTKLFHSGLCCMLSSRAGETAIA